MARGAAGWHADRELVKKLEGLRFTTQRCRAHVEYQMLIPDVVMVSTLIG